MLSEEKRKQTGGHKDSTLNSQRLHVDATWKFCIFAVKMPVEDVSWGTRRKGQNQKRSARCFAVQHIKKNAKEISDVTLAFEDLIECAIEMVEMEYGVLQCY